MMDDICPVCKEESRSAPSVADMVDSFGGIDWANDESVVRAAVYEATVCAVKSETGGWFISTGTNDGREYGYSHRDDPKFAWEQARRHPVVIAFEAKHRALPSAANAEEEWVRQATSRPPCQATLDDTLDCQAPDCPCANPDAVEAVLALVECPDCADFTADVNQDGTAECACGWKGTINFPAKPADWEEARTAVLCKNCDQPIQPCGTWGWHHVDGPVLCFNGKPLEATPASRLSTSGAGLETQAKEPVGYFYRRGAERLANAVDALIQRKVISSRSEAADALLDFRQGDVGRSSKLEEDPDAGFEEWLATRRDGYHQSGRWYLEDHEVVRMRECWIAARKGGRS